MSPNEWTIIGVFVATQIILFVGGIVAMKGDGKLLQVQMTDVREELKQLARVVISQAQHQVILNNMQETITLTGRRIDTVDKRVNKLIDALALNINARALLVSQEEDDSD